MVSNCQKGMNMWPVSRKTSKEGQKLNAGRFFLFSWIEQNWPEPISKNFFRKRDCGLQEGKDVPEKRY